MVPNVTFYTDFVSDASKVSLTESVVDEMPALDLKESHDELAAAGLLSHFPSHRRDLPGEGEIKLRHYELTTLFNNTKLPVDVYEARRGPFGKGPVRRSIWIGDDARPGPGARVPVVVADATAFHGAIHVCFVRCLF